MTRSKLKIPEELIKNRGLDPSHPEYFHQIHQLDAFVAAIANVA